MKAVKLVVFLMFVLLLSGRQALAQYSEENTVMDQQQEAPAFEEPAQVIDLTGTGETPSEDAVVAEDVVNEIKETTDSVINEIENAASETASETPTEDAQTTDTPAETPAEETAGAQPDQSIVDAVQAELTERRKASGKLDIFDANANKVRTLDLIEFKAGTKQDGDNEVVQADFRDTSSGDIVTMDIKVQKEDIGYAVKEMTITNVAEPTAKEVKKDYTDEEVIAFMKDYIDVQSQGTGTFDLYDEKTQKMRNLQLVTLDPKVRRYGIITISTATFTDKNTNDTVMVDVNAENKNGLGITAMRIKGVKKAPAPQQQ